MYRDRHDIRSFLRTNQQIAAVSISDAKGSTPRDSDAWMLVSQNQIFRTIGGGNLELIAIEKARQFLKSTSEPIALSIPLGPEIGQCCGGHVELTIERVEGDRLDEFVARIDREFEELPSVFIFGAGHVGRCLAEAFLLLPVRSVLVDQRESELQSAAYGIDICLTALPETIVDTAPAGSAYIVLTHDHSLDFLITKQALERDDASYVGMIGSKTKRAAFKRWLAEEEGPDIASLTCPIGQSVSEDKRPEVIAALVAAEVMASLTKPAQQSADNDIQHLEVEA